MPRRYAPDGTPLFNGKRPEDFTTEDIAAFLAEVSSPLNGGTSDMAKEKENAGTAAREAPADVGARTGQEAAPPEVEVNVRPIEPRGKLIGMADVRIGGLVVEGFKVFNGDKGLWVGPPSVPDNSTRSGYRRTARITDEKLQAVIDGKALEGYNAAVEKLVARAAAVRTVPEKPSIREELREGAEQAARENAARPAPEKAGKPGHDDR